MNFFHGIIGSPERKFWCFFIGQISHHEISVIFKLTEGKKFHSSRIGHPTVLVFSVSSFSIGESKFKTQRHFFKEFLMKLDTKISIQSKFTMKNRAVNKV